MTAIALEGREVILESAVIIAVLTPPASEIKALPGIPGTRRLKTTPETGVEALETTRGVDTSAAVVPSEAGLSPTPRPTASRAWLQGVNLIPSYLFLLFLSPFPTSPIEGICFLASSGPFPFLTIFPGLIG